MLELHDIQHFLLSRPPASVAPYEFVSFRDAVPKALGKCRHRERETP